MAPNSSSMFNDAPTESKAATSNAPSGESSLIASPPSVVTTDVCPVMSVLTSTTSRQTIPPVSECMMKQSAPQMEHAVEERLTPPPSATSTTMRFVRVASSVVPEDVRVLMPLHKSCLKRSSPTVHGADYDIPKSTEPIAPIQPASDPVESLQKNKRRCWECNVKIGLAAVTCRCEFTFCNKHRYAEEHKCPFNFKSAAKRKLEQENPRVVPAKFARMN